MPSLSRPLLAGATVAVLLGAATACGDDSDGDQAPNGSGGASSSLSDLEFAGDEPLAWPRADVCGDALLVSQNLLSGQGSAAIYQGPSGDGTQVEVQLSEDSELEPAADWATALDCVETADGVVALARYSPVMDEEGVGGAWAGFDLEGQQLWVHEFSEYTHETIGYDVVAFESGEVVDENAQTTIVDPTSGEVTKTVTADSSSSPVPINDDRYVGADGLADLTGDIVNADVMQYDAQGFGAGSRVLVDALDLAAFDAESGKQLWTTDVPDPLSDFAYDASQEVLVWEADGTVYGVEAESGEQLWSYQLDHELTGDVDHAGSGIAVVGNPLLDEDYVVLDTLTGRPVKIPAGLHVMSAASGGIAVVEDGKLRVVDRDQLG